MPKAGFSNDKAYCGVLYTYDVVKYIHNFGSLIHLYFVLCFVFLAHLSRRLIGELLVYRGIRRPSVVRPSSVNIFKRHLL